MKTTVHDHSLELLHSTTIRISGELSSGMQWRMNAGLDSRAEKDERADERASKLPNCWAPAANPAAPG
jgi:hypothetical protein